MAIHEDKNLRHCYSKECPDCTEEADSTSCRYSQRLLGNSNRGMTAVAKGGNCLYNLPPQAPPAPKSRLTHLTESELRMRWVEGARNSRSVTDFMQSRLKLNQPNGFP